MAFSHLRALRPVLFGTVAVLSIHAGAAAQAAEEMNRYSTAKLAVDPSVAGLKVSGLYRVGDNSAFAQSLAKLLPITVRQIGDTLVLTADPDQ